MPWQTPRLWDNERCFILGGGTSIPYQFNVPEDVIIDVSKKIKPPNMLSPYMTSIHNEHVIGINNAYQIGNWIDFIFFGDCTWYHRHRKRLAQFPGIKVTCCRHLKGKEDDPERIKYLAKTNVGIAKDNTKVGWNKNSGSAAISLAAHLGVKQIILLGFDMSLSSIGISHWFGSHKNKNIPIPPFKRHLQGFPQIQADAQNRGIEILNASPESAIKVFRKVQLKDIL